MAHDTSRMDYGHHLVLYSGGADSTYFVHQEQTAKHLLHFRGLNDEMTKVAVANAIRFDRRITVADFSVGGIAGFFHGPRNEYHALLDASMVLNAGIMAINFGMKGLVLGLTREDVDMDIAALTSILRRAEPRFEILTPLRETSAKAIRDSLYRERIPYVSCMISRDCGHCPKCERGC
ncbi:hypothetical protein [Polyangium aurulentum]|uniref:hypothetical protein n=1 Tax=Polyangium aurulentum TaxID=2567896 RepID=UPI0010AEAB1C|nr:hypothetical protein [Polyangium aurulentum]UQA54876.1 hypothetical protein E8A73_026300 [Polyangium aurulentum]